MRFDQCHIIWNLSDSCLKVALDSITIGIVLVDQSQDIMFLLMEPVTEFEKFVFETVQFLILGTQLSQDTFDAFSINIGLSCKYASAIETITSNNHLTRRTSDSIIRRDWSRYHKSGGSNSTKRQHQN